MTYLAPDNSPIRIDPDRRAETVRRVLLTLEAYRAAYNWEPAYEEVRVYPALTTPSHLPCGVANAGGCAYPGGPLFVAGDVDGLMHELHHLHRFALGDPAWKEHSAAHWDAVNRWSPPW